MSERVNGRFVASAPDDGLTPTRRYTERQRDERNATARSKRAEDPAHREALCHRCNSSIGYANDSSERMRAGASYLEGYGR